MTITQTKEYVVGVLKGWFTNKKILDKFSEDSSGKLLYDGNIIEENEEEIDIEQAITETLTLLNQQE